MCLACKETPDFDQARGDEFGERVLKILNSGALALMISLGHRTRLFDALADLNAATSVEVARAANLNERYVREWLKAMVVGRILEYSPEDGTYRLPSEHAAFLTRRSPETNVAATSQFLPVLAAVEDNIVTCFERGGGVPYSKYPRFHAVMAEESGQTTLPALVDRIVPLVPGIETRLEEGIDVLDLGCGRGKALNILARTYPRSRFLGVDFSREALAFAREEASGIGNLRFQNKDAARFKPQSAFDLVLTFDAIHDQAQPLAVLKNIRHALREGGTYLMQDIDTSSDVSKNIDNPLGPLIYTISCMHCMTVSLSSGGAGLGAAWGFELAGQMLREAGFTQIEIHRLPHDIQNCYYVSRF